MKAIPMTSKAWGIGILGVLGLIALLMAVNPARAASPGGTIPPPPDTPLAVGRVNLQVIELKQKREYLVYATEAGIAASVELLGIEVSKGKGDLSFVDVTAFTEFIVSDKPGVHHLKIDLPKDFKDINLIEIKVRHTHGGGLEHFGAALFNRHHNRNLGAGQ